MLRLLISFGLALIGHLYLLQVHLGIDPPSLPQLISDSSVSVTLNQYSAKKSATASPESPDIPPKRAPQQPVEQQKTTPAIAPPETEPAVKPEVELKPRPESKPTRKIKKPEAIKPVARKVRKKVQVPELEPELKPVHETKPVQKEKKREEVPRKTAPVKQDHTLPKKSVAANSSPKSESSKDTKNSKSATTSSSVVEARPLYQFNPKPVYPNLARRRGWEGVVMLLVEVTEEGEVALVRLHKSCGHKILDKSAIRAVKTWRFLAGIRNGKRTESTVIIPVHFKLHNS